MWYIEIVERAGSYQFFKWKVKPTEPPSEGHVVSIITIPEEHDASVNTLIKIIQLLDSKPSLD